MEEECKEGVETVIDTTMEVDKGINETNDVAINNIQGEDESKSETNAVMEVEESSVCESENVAESEKIDTINSNDSEKAQIQQNVNDQDSNQITNLNVTSDEASKQPEPQVVETSKLSQSETNIEKCHQSETDTISFEQTPNLDPVPAEQDKSLPTPPVITSEIEDSLSKPDNSPKESDSTFKPEDSISSKPADTTPESEITAPQPEDPTPQPEDAAATQPEDEVAQLMDPMSVLEDSVSTTEDSTSIPEDSISKPEDSTSIPEDSMSKPEDSTSIPEDSISKPEDSTLNHESLCNDISLTDEDKLEKVQESVQNDDENNKEHENVVSDNTSEKDKGEVGKNNSTVLEDTSEIETNKNDDTSKEDSPPLNNIVKDLLDSEIVCVTESDDNKEGADAELCIIPNTHREITQAEKDAALSLPSVKDLGTSAGHEDGSEHGEKTKKLIILHKYQKGTNQMCHVCKIRKKMEYYWLEDGQRLYTCGNFCLDKLKRKENATKIVQTWEEGSLRVKNFTDDGWERKCEICKKTLESVDKNLTWELMDFCDVFCLTKYQKQTGSTCAHCQEEVKCVNLGKFCARAGKNLQQFCSMKCFEEHMNSFRVCSYCLQHINKEAEIFLGKLKDQNLFIDFCSMNCLEKYRLIIIQQQPTVPPGTLCCVCKEENPIVMEFEHKGKTNYFCQERCFIAFSFVDNISSGKCSMCRKHFSTNTLEKHKIFHDNILLNFCSDNCKIMYVGSYQKAVSCHWCKCKKYNFEMIQKYSKETGLIYTCSVSCLTYLRVSLNALNSTKMICHQCSKFMSPLYHLTMSDSSVRNFCSYNCVKAFQNNYDTQQMARNNVTKPVPASTPATRKTKNKPIAPAPQKDVPKIPIISNVQSLATNGSIEMSNVVTPPPLAPIPKRSARLKTSTNSTQIINKSPQIINSYGKSQMQVQNKIKRQFIVRNSPLPEQRNVSTMCAIRKLNKGSLVKPEMVDKEAQTEETRASKILIPMPMPIHVPTPMQMYTTSVPVPVPIPIPIPVPIFIPTTRNSAAGIMKEIKKIQVKIPTDPYEAEILMMAEMVAEEKKEDLTDSESDVDDAGGAEDGYSPEPVDASNTFGDDMLQMALKMATELDEPAVDLEGALTANTITAPQGSESHGTEENADENSAMHHHLMERSQTARRKRRGSKQVRGVAKRKRNDNQVDMPLMQVQQPPPPPEPIEKPDANMCLKYTFGVNAWKQWVTTKNAELEKSSRIATVMPKLFKTEILQLTADELNYSLCLFVKEVRKPNGAEYAPDTIYYLCLGIQQYLFENGRIDNIFCDTYYEKFTDCLDEVAKKFSVLYNDSHYIVTRVEEEHLWESKQLGAHSPHVLLSTLMFFNTKHFNLTSVDEHMQLSFSHIMKHWKRNPNQPGASKMPGARNVLLRFYPPQSAIQNNARKKKVYEQQENEENPLRCPVKLYEFYLSKCPESVKTRNDVFYLQPERSCVPDSPVWYSTMALPREALEKMLHRVKMVKEINVALLTS